MKKLLCIILFLLFLTANVGQAQFNDSEPMFGQQLNLGHWSTDGLVFLWRGIEAGNAVDESPYHNDGTITGAVWAGGGLSFDGTDDVITMALPATFVADNPVTVIISAKQTTSDTECLVNIQAAAGDPGQILLCYLNGGNRCRTSQASIGSRNQASVTTINTNVWNQYTLTHPGTNTRGDIYVNGVLANGTPVDVLSNFGANEFTIGAGFSATFDFTGDIAYCYVYGRVLSANEIQQLYINPNLPMQQQPIWLLFSPVPDVGSLQWILGGGIGPSPLKGSVVK